MKKLATLAIAFFLVLSAIPAMAADQAGDTSVFQAFSTLPAAQRDTLTPMTDTELAAIEGGDTCTNCSISATVTATQSNTSTVTQTASNSGNSSATASQAVGTGNDNRNSARSSISVSNRARVSQSNSISFRIN